MTNQSLKSSTVNVALVVILIWSIGMVIIWMVVALPDFSVEVLESIQGADAASSVSIFGLSIPLWVTEVLVLLCYLGVAFFILRYLLSHKRNNLYIVFGIFTLLLLVILV